MIKCYICGKPILVSKPISHGVTFEKKIKEKGKNVGEEYHFECKHKGQIKDDE